MSIIITYQVAKFTMPLQYELESTYLIPPAPECLGEHNPSLPTKTPMLSHKTFKNQYLTISLTAYVSVCYTFVPSNAN